MSMLEKKLLQGSDWVHVLNNMLTSMGMGKAEAKQPEWSPQVVTLEYDGNCDNQAGQVFVVCHFLVHAV